MTELTTIRLRTLGWFALFPGVFIGLVPWWLHHRVEGAFVWDGSVWRWGAIWLILNGLGLAGWCVNLFNVEGRGTPVPFDPPKRFVATGPYRFVRNPMALGLFLVLGGEAALYESKAVVIYLLLVIGLIHAFVCWVEEPDLTRRFGASYAAYKHDVPRWIPRPIAGAPPPKIR
jgi:protein-S-isoprenylcysteine O-methyltransferase Ste14